MKPTRSALIRCYISDHVVAHVARVLAVKASSGWGDDHIVVNIGDYVLQAIMVGRPDEEFSDGLRAMGTEYPRVVKVLLKLGLITKHGRGTRERYLLAPVALPTSVAIADAVHVELAMRHSSEVPISFLAHESPAMAMLGLEGQRAVDALHRTVGIGRLTLHSMCGVDSIMAADAMKPNW